IRLNGLGESHEGVIAGRRYGRNGTRRGRRRCAAPSGKSAAANRSGCYRVLVRASGWRERVIENQSIGEEILAAGTSRHRTVIPGQRRESRLVARGEQLASDNPLIDR